MELNFAGLRSTDGKVSEHEFNRLVDVVQSITLNQGVNYRVFRTPAGTTIQPGGKGKGGGVAPDHYSFQVYKSPYTGTGDPPDDQALRIKLYPGFLNTKMPENMDNELTVTDDAENFVYIEGTFSADGVLSSCVLEVDTDLPEDPEGTENIAPATSSRPLAVVTASGGAITSIVQCRRGSLV